MEIARRNLGQFGEPPRRREEEGGDGRPDERAGRGGPPLHFGLDEGSEGGLGALQSVEVEAGVVDAGEFGGGEGASRRGGAGDADGDDLVAGEDVVQSVVDEGDVHFVLEDADGLAVLEGVGEELFEFREFGVVELAEVEVGALDFVGEGEEVAVGLEDEVVLLAVLVAVRGVRVGGGGGALGAGFGVLIRLDQGEVSLEGGVVEEAGAGMGGGIVGAVEIVAGGL